VGVREQCLQDRGTAPLSPPAEDGGDVAHVIPGGVAASRQQARGGLRRERTEEIDEEPADGNSPVADQGRQDQVQDRVLVRAGERDRDFALGSIQPSCAGEDLREDLSGQLGPVEEEARHRPGGIVCEPQQRRGGQRRDPRFDPALQAQLRLAALVARQAEVDRIDVRPWIHRVFRHGACRLCESSCAS
jgi:hypothetical protein